ncbi:MAG: hypothetical protein IJU40_05975 [Desulfovibrionaceae bacterium]|nr:hypothetical protein [Desulfovibrionaceae bacterium]
MKESLILLGCVNTRVSLIGIDINKKEAFWYCPSNIQRTCGICYGKESLYISSDNHLTKINSLGISSYKIPGRYNNFAHSIKIAYDSHLGLADTGNSQIHLFDGQNFTLSFSPLECWNEIPIDAIHVNDFLPFNQGMLVSAFSYQPFTAWKSTSFDWKHDGWGCLYYLRRFEHKTVSRIVASGLNCPHSLNTWDDDIYCCASASGDWIQFQVTKQGLLYEKKRIHVSDTHFLRGALRHKDGWLLGGSSQRHADGSGGMHLYYLSDDGSVQLIWEGGSGEIYEILPWDPTIMSDVCTVLAKAPVAFHLDENIDQFPPRCELPLEYRF